MEDKRGETIEVKDGSNRNTYRTSYVKANARHALWTPRDVLTVGCWNVRTLNGPGTIEILDRELERFDWDIVGIAETHVTGTGELNTDNIKMMYSGHETEHRAGVGLVLSKNAAQAMVSFKPINERLLVAKFRVWVGWLKVIQVYAPTTAASEREINEFYNLLQEEVSAVARGDKLILIGDFNANVGKADGATAGKAIGQHGYGNRKARGDILVDFCILNNLFTTKTFFRQAKVSRCLTWEAPGGRYRNQIDFIIANEAVIG